MLAKRILLVVALGLSLFKPLYAIDGDYNIPYTDNYGYEYDPATGTYVQKNVPAPATATDHSAVQDTTTVTSEPAPTTTPAEANNSITTPAEANNPDTAPAEAKTAWLPLIIAGVFAILGFTLAAVRMRKKPLQG